MAKLKNVDEEKIAALVFKSLITANKVVIKKVSLKDTITLKTTRKMQNEKLFAKYGKRS